MAIALVQTPGTWVGLPGSQPVSQAFGSPNTSGNLLIAFVSTSGGNFNLTEATTATVSDTAGNTWKRAGTYAASALGIWYCDGCVAGANTVTFNPGNATPLNNSIITIAEYSGQLLGHALDFAGGVASSTISPTGGAFVAQAGFLIINAWTTNNVVKTWSSPSGITLRTPTTSVVQVWGDAISVAGDNHISVSIGASPDAIGAMAVFLPATYQKEAGFKWVRTAQLPTSPDITHRTRRFAGGNQGGNCILVKIVTANNSTSVISGITDTAGNTYVAVKQQHNTNGLNDMVELWAANNIANTNVDNTVTVTASVAPANAFVMTADEYSGQSLGTLLDSSAVANNQTSMSYNLTAAKAGQNITLIGDHGSGGVQWSGIPATFTDRFYYNPNEYSGPLPNQGGGVFGGNTSMYVADGPSVSGSNTIILTVNNTSSSLAVSLNRAAQITGNAGVAGATVSYSGAASGSVTADGSGNYTIPNLNAGSYTITPSKSGGFSFTPASSNQSVSTATDISGVNFSASGGGIGTQGDMLTVNRWCSRIWP